ncbi:MAG: hypothetical protein RLZZ117_355, partial [Cyanobacteriota bacterium]
MSIVSTLYRSSLIAALAALAALLASPSLAQEIGVYSGRHYNTDKELYKQFTKQTG